MIAIVTVVEFRPVRTRVTDYEAPDLGKVSGGILFTLQVEEVLCAKTDFDVKAKKARPKPEKILVFKDRIDGGFYRLGERYLVFLTPHREQKDLATKYRLEAETTYYEAFEGKSGLISLSGKEPAAITKIKQFCQALDTADPKVKIQRLNTLLGSGDADLEMAVGQAIDFFLQQMMQR